LEYRDGGLSAAVPPGQGAVAGKVNKPEKIHHEGTKGVKAGIRRFVL
jgi:hypothetical protein